MRHRKDLNLYPPPNGPTESAEQVTELDTTFLLSDPFGYFVSRIGMLHTWARIGGRNDAPVAEPRTATGDPGDSDTAIGRPDLFPIVEAVMRDEQADPPSPMIVSAQVAVDAFALRHHIAEALIRLFVACSERSISGGQTTTSLWSRMTDDKNLQTQQLIAAAAQASRDLDEARFGILVVPANVLEETDLPRINQLKLLCARWIEYAVELLSPAGLDANSAHNKVKHGLAVRGRADLRVSFSTVGPDEDGNVPISAFNEDNSFDILDRPTLEFMSRPKLPGSHKQGLEVTQLRLDYRSLLAESAMLAFAHGALFHVAASRHFASRPVPEGLRVAPHPGLVGGEFPQPRLGGHQVGMRFPITTPPGGGAPRDPSLWTADGTALTLNVTGDRLSGRVVADHVTGPESDDEADEGDVQGSIEQDE